MPKTKKKYFLILFTLFFFNVNSQVEPTFKLDHKNGLASNEVYSVLQDFNGKLWFTTDNGISLFNGFSIKNYSTQDGLLDNVVFKQCIDSKGNIWFGSANRKIFYFNGAKFLPALNKYGDTISFEKREIMDMFSIKDTIYISTSYRTYKIIPENKCFKIIDLLPKKINSDIHIKKIHNRFCVTFTKENVSSPFLSLKIEDGNNDYYFNLVNKPNLRSMFKRVSQNQNKLYLSIGKELILIENGKIIQETTFPNEIIYHAFNSSNGDVFVKHYGLFQTNAKRIQNHSRNFYENQTITQRFIDREGGTWLTTLESGVIYDASYTKSLLFLDIDKKVPISNFAINGQNEIWHANKLGDLSRLTGNQFNSEFFEINIGQEILDIKVDPDLLVLSSSLGVHLYKINNGNFKEIALLPFASYTISNILNQCYYLTDGYNIFYYKKNKQLKSIPFKERIYSLYQTSDNLYIGTKSGLYKYSKDKIIKINIKGLPEIDRIQVINIQGSNIYLGTKSSGLYIYNIKSKNVVHFNEGKNSIVDKTITAISFINKNEIVIGTQKGISKLIYQNGGYEILNFDVSDGMASDQIKCLTVYQGFLLWGTYEGLFGWPLNNLRTNNIAPVNSILKVELLNGHNFKKELSHNDNNVRIYFSSSSFRTFGRVKVKYKLKSNDSKYFEINNSNGILTLNSLQPGNYSVEILTANNNGLWSKKPAVVQFNIASPFWQNWIFILLFSVIVSSIIYLLVRRRFKRLRTIENEKQFIHYQIEMLKTKALRLQINPHFLFNALNNIQGYYASTNVQKAKDYIYHLSRLLRLILETSNDETIGFHQELELIDFYITLNQFRYEDKISFQKKLDKKLFDREIIVPPLITQPFIENALIHCSEDNSIIHILLETELVDGVFIITITDSGTTISPEKILHLRNSKLTKGIGLTIERVKTFNSQNNYFNEPVDFIINEKGGLSVRIFLKQQV